MKDEEIDDLIMYPITHFDRIDEMQCVFVAINKTRGNLVSENLVPRVYIHTYYFDHVKLKFGERHEQPFLTLCIYRSERRWRLISFSFSINQSDGAKYSFYSDSEPLVELPDPEENTYQR